jgi:hypothetical protein
MGYWFVWRKDMCGRCCLTLALCLLCPSAYDGFAKDPAHKDQRPVQLGCEDEFAGKLERIDSRTITLRVSDDQRVVVNVDHHKRGTAAPFLGKSVVVRVQKKDGAQWAEMLAPRRP